MNKSAGFILVEAVVALVIMGIMVGLLLVTQGRTMRAGLGSAHELLVQQALTVRFAELDRAGTQPVSGASCPLPDMCPVGTMVYTAQPVDKKGPLGQYTGLYQEQLTATWQEGNRTYQHSLTRYQYYEPQAP